MSFLNIKDPKKRVAIVREFHETKNKIKQNYLNERIGNIEEDYDLKKFFKPVIETQKEMIETQKEMIESQKEVSKNFMSSTLPKSITSPELLSIPFIEPHFLGDIAEKYLRKFASKENVDKTFGLYDKEDKFYIGNKEVNIINDVLKFEDKEYESTDGLWELIISKTPKDYTNEDYKNYGEIMDYTNSIRHHNDPKELAPKASKSWKWKNIMKPLWEKSKHGSGIFLPKDSNALIERLRLLMASKQAGNTGLRNDLVSICDELYRQKVIDKNNIKFYL